MSSFRLALVPAILMFAMACGDGYSSSPAPSPVPPAAPPAAGTQAAVTIPAGAEFLGNRAFVPAQLDITAGTTVTWRNTDATTHTSTSNAPGWNSGDVRPNGEFTRAFTTPGTFSYHCTIHPSMVGTVVVR
jgi:plastocyanin